MHSSQMFNTNSPQGLNAFTTLSRQVPSVTASVATLPEAFRPTAFRTALHGPETWRSDHAGGWWAAENVSFAGQGFDGLQ